MMKKKPFIGYYNRSVYLTYFSVAVSAYGIFFSLQKGLFAAALLCLMVCGLCDMFDGMIASKTKRTDEEKRFGIQIDSLCDLLNFGVFPATIGYSIGVKGFFPVTCMVWFVLAAVIRLSYFNVEEEMRQSATQEKRKFYRGLPVTSVAMIIPIVLMLNHFVFRMNIARIYAPLLLVLGILFVCGFKIPKPKGRSLWIMAFAGLIVFFIVMLYGRLFFS